MDVSDGGPEGGIGGDAVGMTAELGKESELGGGHEMEDVKEDVIRKCGESGRGIATP